MINLMKLTMLTVTWHACMLVDVSVEDSGNYTCQVFGRRSVVLAIVTHTVIVRGTYYNHPLLSVAINIASHLRSVEIQVQYTASTVGLLSEQNIVVVSSC